MSMSNPESDLSSDQLAQLSGWKREFADLLDQVLAIGGGATVSAYVSVVDHGAVGDGVTDDTAAIKAAMTEAVLRSLPVFFPMTTGGGRYLIVSTNAPARQPAIELDSTYSHLKLIGGGGAGIVIDTVCIDGVSGSPGIEVQSGFHDLDVDGLGFYGPSGLHSDDKDYNFFGAIKMGSGSTDVRIRNCKFERTTPVDTASAMSGNDEPISGRLLVESCFMHNCPNGIHPPSDFKIDRNFFICDTIISTRAQAIYKFGAFSNGSITNNTFYRINKQAVQIRGVEAQWNEMNNFRIIGNTFIECDQYAIFCGSDSYPNVTQAVISNNTFKNCNGPIQAQGLGSGTITGNVVHFTWEWPFSLPNPFSVGISVTTGVGLPGHYAVTRGIVISDNKLAHVHPYVGKVTFNSNPADGDSILVGGITYTFRNSPSTAWDVQRDTTARNTLDYFIQALRGYGDQILNMNNVMRSALDAFNNYYGATPNIGVIVSNFSFSITPSGAWCTATAVQDYRAACRTAIAAQFLIGATIANNNADDFVTGYVTQNCRSCKVVDNKNSNQTGQANAILEQYSVDMRFRDNHCVTLDFLNRGAPSYNIYQTGFSVIDDDNVQIQEGCNGALMGRAGRVTIGDKKAFNWFWYGRGIADSDPPDASTESFRFREGDIVVLFDGAVDHTFTYKFVSPGAGEFNSPDSLLALFQGVAGFDAEYMTYTNRLVTPDAKCMMRVFATAAGTAGNSARLRCYRPKWPGAPEASADSTPQPMINGYILRNAAAAENFSQFQGGSAAFDTTFVFTPLANPDRGVEVWGADAASVALAPAVYSADIIPGVGFKITHGAGVGTEQFHYLVK